MIAVHSQGRDRDSIWRSVKGKQVCGTSGLRILLWFNLVDEAKRVRAPMGATVAADEMPRFSIRAVGSFEQNPCCPDSALPVDEIECLCMGECYNPLDRRRPITRLEVVRIRPQTSLDEEIGSLIDDLWKVFECSGEAEGCRAEFSDPDYVDYVEGGRDTVYYVRAIEAPKPTMNGTRIRVVDGEMLRCPGSFDEDDCLAPEEPRVWSAPIFVEFPSRVAENKSLEASGQGC